MLFNIGFTQPANDLCSNAIKICDSNPVNGSTTGATAQTGPNAPDGPNAGSLTCFPFEQTVWYEFTTNSTGGDVSINISGVVCAGIGNDISGILYQAGTPCDNSTYAVASNCQANSAVGFTLTALGLAANTTYYVQLSSGKDCNFDIEAMGPGITNIPATLVINSSAGGTICEQTPVTFTANPTDCDNPIYTWIINGIVVQTGGATFTSSDIKNNDNVSAQIACACGPGATSNTIIMSMHPNIANAGPDQIIPFGSSTDLDGSGGMNPIWTPGNTLSDPTVYNPSATPSISTVYTLTVNDPNGCTFEDSVLIQVIDSITVPNTFTPNGDGVNDTWQILNIENFPEVKIIVYDRWGQEVYKTIGYTPAKRWNGTNGGKQLPASTYYYVISLSITAKDKKLVTGSVTIVY